MARIFVFGKKVVGNMSITIYDVANAFLTMDSMTHKKLQKLCYYAQGWHLALYKARLFDSHFEAWVHGPVSPDLYKAYKSYGWLDVPKQSVIADSISPKIDFLQAVYDTYGKFSGDQLEALTHSERPWREARGNLEEWEPSNNRINENNMQEYYWRIYEQNQND